MRPRKPENSSLPPNLYREKQGYFYYIRPDTKKKIGLGKVYDDAVTAAKNANAELNKSTALTNRILNDQTKTSFGELADWVETNVWEPRTRKRPDEKDYLSPATLKSYRQAKRAIVAEFKSLPVNDHALTVKTISPFFDRQTPRMRNHYRAVLSIIFVQAKDKGLMTTNPAMLKLKAPVETVRKRLTLALYVAIRAKLEPWFQDLCDTCYYTSLRVGDLVRLKWAFLSEEDGKTYLKRLPKKGIKMSRGQKYLIHQKLEAVFKRCRRVVGSEYIHHYPFRVGTTKKLAGRPLTEGQASKAFAKARTLVFQERPDLFVTPDEHERETGKMRPMTEEEFPTLHSVRSLAARLREAQRDDSEKLLGHADDNMKATYLSGYDIKWVVIDLDEPSERREM